MRDNLKNLNDKNIIVIGKFSKFGRKPDTKTGSVWNTILLTDVKFKNGKNACDHLWFVAKKSMLQVDIKSNSIIEVKGKVTRYKRRNNTIDYCINDYICKNR